MAGTFVLLIYELTPGAPKSTVCRQARSKYLWNGYWAYYQLVLRRGCPPRLVMNVTVPHDAPLPTPCLGLQLLPLLFSYPLSLTAWHHTHLFIRVVFQKGCHTCSLWKSPTILLFASSRTLPVYVVEAQ